MWTGLTREKVIEIAERYDVARGMCSPECRSARKRAQDQQYRREGRYRPYERRGLRRTYTGACVVCGLAFSSKNKGTRTCGSKCGAILNGRIRTERARVRNSRRCELCDTAFRPANPSAKQRRAGHQQRFCSSKCANPATNQRGEHDQGFSNDAKPRSWSRPIADRGNVGVATKDQNWSKSPISTDCTNWRTEFAGSSAFQNFPGTRPCVSWRTRPPPSRRSLEAMKSGWRSVSAIGFVPDTTEWMTSYSLIKSGAVRRCRPTWIWRSFSTGARRPVGAKCGHG
jgi:predicted nucleic acid-binding Zn ribbon protein